MKYIAFETTTGKIKHFYDSPTPIAHAPNELDLLQVGDECLGGIVDSHKVVDGQLVLIE